MRDFERLEELSGTVATGLAAGSVVLAIDAVLANRAHDARQRAALTDAAELLRALADPSAVIEPGARSGRGGLAASGPALEALDVAEAHLGGDVRRALERLSDALAAAAKGEQTEGHRDDLTVAADMFSLLGDLELSRANGILRRRAEPAAWLRTRTTSPS